MLPWCFKLWQQYLGAFISYLFFGMICFIFIYVSVSVYGLWRPENIGSPVARGTGKCEPPMWCWELNTGPWEGQQGLVTVESSLLAPLLST